MFWPLVGFATVCESLAAALLAIAAFSDPVPRRFAVYDSAEGDVVIDVLGRTTSLSWDADRGVLLAAAVFAMVGLLAFGAAAARR